MPLSLACPSCGARLRAPDRAAGRTLPCPHCKAPMVIPLATGPAAAFAFESAPSAAPSPTDDFDDEGNPFDDEGTDEAPSELDPTGAPKKGRRSAAKKKPKAGGFNPFDAEVADEEPTADQPKKRRYRKDGDYNPFGDVPVEEVPDPAGEGFEFGIEAAPPTPANEFDFGPKTDDDDPRRR